MVGAVAVLEASLKVSTLFTHIWHHIHGYMSESDLFKLTTRFNHRGNQILGMEGPMVVAVAALEASLKV